jgi:L-amino acid N-acyltransferase YncA
VTQRSDAGGGFTIRTAHAQDAAAITAIIEGVASEQIYSAINRPWSIEEQHRYLCALSGRETVHVAETAAEGVVGYQILELWAPTLESMAHVGQVGTFLRPAWRSRGVGLALFTATAHFARQYGFAKFVAMVRASNAQALRFYQRLGFRECGRLSRQVRIGAVEDDEILMEMFL